MRCVFDNGRKCFALTKKDCEGCTFYKTYEELQASRTATIKRLQKLGIYNSILATYNHRALRIEVI